MSIRVQVVLSEEEYAEVQARAGLVPLSAWFRALALGAKKPSRAAAERPEIEYGSDELPSGGSVAVPLIERQRRPVETWRRGPRQKGDKSR
jgi:hypothetical protein